MLCAKLTEMGIPAIRQPRCSHITAIFCGGLPRLEIVLKLKKLSTTSLPVESVVGHDGCRIAGPRPALSCAAIYQGTP